MTIFGAVARRLCGLISLMGVLFVMAVPGQAQVAQGPVAQGPVAQGLTALARLDPAQSDIADHGGDVAIDLALSQAVPFRVMMMSDPVRLVVDFRELDFGAADSMERLDRSAHVTRMLSGAFRPGWSRMVAELDAPFKVRQAWMETGEGSTGAKLHLRLEPTDAAGLAAVAADPATVLKQSGWDLPEADQLAAVPKRRQTGDAPLVVVLDPGHGGIDPGAQAAGLNEKDITLSFARALRERLLRDGCRVVLTRDEDEFVPLETRVTIARQARADLFLSIHADALAEGKASGATVYTMGRDPSDRAAEQLAERHDRTDLLVGVDLTGQDDRVADVLMDLARAETRPRSDRLAKELSGAFKAAHLPTHSHPVQHAHFSVLKAPDIPSALIELGYLSSPGDRSRLTDPAWRAKAVAAVAAGIESWARADAAEARLVRQ